MNDVDDHDRGRYLRGTTPPWARLLVVIVVLLTVSACGDSTGTNDASSTSEVPSTFSSVSTASSATPTSRTTATTTIPAIVPSPATVRADGCRAQPVADSMTQEVVADVDGNGRPDHIRTYLQPSQYRLGESWLQVSFDDGRHTEAVAVETPDLLAALDLDRDGRLEIFVSNEGNTARGGGIMQLQGCALRRVVDGSGQPFVYVYYATGRSCAPACYPNVECRLSDTGFVLVVSNAQRANIDPLVPNIPPLTDDLPYTWRRDLFRLEGGGMTSIAREQGTTRHADLPIPKRQGFNCTVPTS
jgi:hypothetical protein